MKPFKLLFLLPVFSYAQLTESVVCQPPSNLSVNYISCDSMEFTWDSDTGVISSTIEWDTSGFVLGTGNQIQGLSSSYSIAGLIPNSDYDFYVKDSCANDSSIWVGPFSFNTDSLGPPMANFIYGHVPPVNGGAIKSTEFLAWQSQGIGNSYFWDFDDGNTAVGDSALHTYSVVLIYNVKLLVTNPCGSDSITLPVIPEFISLNERPLVEVKVNIYPNPASDFITIDYDLLKGFKDGILTLEVFNLSGKKLLERELIEYAELKEKVDLSGLSQGIYILKISDFNKVWHNEMISVTP